MNSIERLRQIHANPIEIENIAFPFTHEMGVEARLVDDPQAYIDQVRMIDPRYASSTGDKRNLSRQQAQSGHLAMDELLIPALMNICDALGITEPEYPLNPDVELDAIIVTGGVLTAYYDRVDFALTGPNVEIFVAGGSRPISEAEEKVLELKGIKPNSYFYESDLAKIICEEKTTKEKTLKPFVSRTVDPDNRDVIREFALTHPGVKKLGVITTALYVPFTATDGGAVEAELENIRATAFAGASAPEKVALRNQNTYRSELARTLAGAARMHQEQLRRRY